MPEATKLASRWAEVAPLVKIVGGGVALIVCVDTFVHGSDWLAAGVAVLCLVTLKPWRPA